MRQRLCSVLSEHRKLLLVKANRIYIIKCYDPVARTRFQRCIYAS